MEAPGFRPGMYSLRVYSGMQPMARYVFKAYDDIWLEARYVFEA